jgi:signal transduction histidine kinase
VPTVRSAAHAQNCTKTLLHCTRTEQIPRDIEVMEVPLPQVSSGTHSGQVGPLLASQSHVSSVLANLSHELGRQLASLRAGFDLILAESPSPVAQDQRGHLLTMVSLCDDLLRFTRSSLDYAAAAQGSRPLCLGVYTIGALVSEIDRQFAPVASARQIKWECHTTRSESSVITDASRCQQIFGNLASNALKYTPPGGRVRILGRALADSWQVTFADSGPGIPLDSHDRVFEPFVRLPRDERAGIEGSGLGLAICHELVMQLDGKITLESAVTAGTSFTVRFPIGGPTENRG